MTVERGTTNRNARGSSYERRRRRQWLIDTFGDGVTVMCSLRSYAGCLGMLTVETVTADRIVPGIEGGTYRRDNIRPACGPCNSSTGGHLGNTRRFSV